MAKSVSEEKNRGLSTRKQILDKSLEMINDRGFIDFRIDSLAEVLKLSPGNITYHFSKKEDICIQLWQDFLLESKFGDKDLSRMLDLKQMYLITRELCRNIYNYRGIVMYRGGDIRTLCDDEKGDRSLKKSIDDLISKSIELLSSNGYIDTGKNKYSMHTTKNSESLSMRWWINKVVAELGNADKDKISAKIDHNALLILYSLYPILSARGKEEFKLISEIVINGDMSS